MSKPVMSVAQVSVALLKSTPPKLVINASGFVSTSGWENGHLEPRFYVNFPKDGIQDFDFVADFPENMTLMIISPITAKQVEWDNPPESVKGIRVHSQSNDIEATIDNNNTFTFN